MGSSSGEAWYINWTEHSKQKLIGGHRGEICAVAFTADSSLLATSAMDGSLVVWIPETREQLVTFRAPNKACCSVAFSPISGHEKNSFERPAKIKQSNKEGTASLSKMLPNLVAGYADGTVRVFDVGEGRMVKKMQPHGKPVKAVTYSNDGMSDLVYMHVCMCMCICVH